MANFGYLLQKMILCFLHEPGEENKFASYSYISHEYSWTLMNTHEY